MAQITESKNFSFSDRVDEIDFFAVGGGGSGGAAVDHVTSNSNGVAIGGAGGYTATKLGVKNIGLLFTAEIGAGGASKSCSAKGDVSRAEGSPGGSTTVKERNEVILEAAGGNGGYATASYGNSNDTWSVGADGGSGSSNMWAMYQNLGKAGHDGSDGSYIRSGKPGKGQGNTTTAFGEGVGTQFSPAGGSASGYIYGSTLWYHGTDTVGPGGAPAVAESSSDAAYGSNATVFGGGGGAALAIKVANDTGTSVSGAGATGLVIARWRYKQ